MNFYVFTDYKLQLHVGVIFFLLKVHVYLNYLIKLIIYNITKFVYYFYK
jgi:hypothetical protein